LKLFQSVEGKKEEQEPMLFRRHTSARLVVQNPHNSKSKSNSIKHLLSQ
jgi:hypothetical protein